MKIGDQVHYVPAFGQCDPARVIDTGGILTRTVRDAAGQTVMETRDWSELVVRLNVAGLTVSGCAYYWAEDGETTVAKSWHRREECRAAPRGGGRWQTEQVP